MRTVKIVLAVVVLGFIGYFICKSLGNTEPILEPSNQVTNQFRDRIEKEITALKSLPVTEFSKEAYLNIKSIVDNDSKPNLKNKLYSNLGDNKTESDSWKEIYSKNLYSAYADKFIKQSFYVFSNKSCNSSDLAFIRSEYKELQNSPYLESGSPVDVKFKEINAVFNKYDEIKSFISSYDDLRIPDEGIDSEFPISDVRSKLDRVKTYRNELLSHSYLSNCERLFKELSEIPQTLFSKHFKFLNKKIEDYSGLYDIYEEQINHNDKVYVIVKKHIDLLDSGLYEDTELTTSTYNILMRKWDADGTSAYNFYDNKRKEEKNDN